MRLRFSEAEAAMIVQTVSAERATMLANLVRIFRRPSRLIFDLPGESTSQEVSGTVLPIMNVVMEQVRDAGPMAESKI
jgi:hypothetical protein